MPYSVRPSKRGSDGRVIYWGVYGPGGKLAAQVVRTRGEALVIASRLRSIEKAKRR